MATESNIQIDLAVLIDGTITPPGSTSEDYLLRRRVINKVVEDLYDSQDWEHLATVASVNFTDKTGTITMRKHGLLDLRRIGSSTKDDKKFKPVSYETFDNYSAGDYKYREYNGTIDITESDASLTARYIPVAPTLAETTDSVDFPSMLVAAGAYKKLKLIEDPEETNIIQQADAIFKEELKTFTARENRNIPRTFQSKAWGA